MGHHGIKECQTGSVLHCRVGVLNLAKDCLGKEVLGLEESVATIKTLNFLDDVLNTSSAVGKADHSVEDTLPTVLIELLVAHPQVWITSASVVDHAPDSLDGRAYLLDDVTCAALHVVLLRVEDSSLNVPWKVPQDEGRVPRCQKVCVDACDVVDGREDGVRRRRRHVPLHRISNVLVMEANQDLFAIAAHRQDWEVCDVTSEVTIRYASDCAIHNNLLEGVAVQDNCNRGHL